MGQHRYGADVSWGVLDGVHIGATWRIWLNCTCSGDMALCQITLTTCCLNSAILLFWHYFITLLEILIYIAMMLSSMSISLFGMLLCRWRWPGETGGECWKSCPSAVQCASSRCKNDDCRFRAALSSCVCQAAYLRWQPSTWFRNNKWRVRFWCQWCCRHKSFTS